MTLEEMNWDDVIPNITRVRSAIGTFGTIVDKKRLIPNQEDYKDDYFIRWDNGNESAVWWITSGNIEVIS